MQSPPLPELLQSLLESTGDDLRTELSDEEVWGARKKGAQLCAAAEWLRKRANQRNKIVHGHDVRLTQAAVVDWLSRYERLLATLWVARRRATGIDVGPELELHREAWPRLEDEGVRD